MTLTPLAHEHMVRFHELDVSTVTSGHTARDLLAVPKKNSDILCHKGTVMYLAYHC